MNRKLILRLMIISLLALFMVACSSGEETLDDKTKDTTDSASSFPLEITDSTGNTVNLEEEPAEIVSVIPSNTEVLFALGQGDKVVGVTENDTYPEEVLEIDKVGDFELNVEKIISLEPDLVLAHESSVNSSMDAFEQIQDADIDVFFVSDAQSIDDTYKMIEEIGKVTGAHAEALEVIDDMKEGFAEIEAIAADIAEDEKKSVLFEVSPEPEIFTGGSGTFFDELIELVGANNAASELDGWAQISPEAIIDLNPDIILTTYGSYVEEPEEQVLNRDGFSEVTAIKEEAVFDVNEDLVSRPGPRLVEGAREIGAAIYPDHFN